MKVEGRIVRQDLGPGVFLLEAMDGARYTLANADAALKKDGLRVEVEGDVVAGRGIAVQGRVLQVRSFRLLGP